MLENLIPMLAISALPVIFAITLHEAAHGYAARYFGDPTAWLAGRISLNPLVHIDLWGTIIIPIAVWFLSGGQMLFGYAKPVPVDFGRLRHPKQDMLWVAAAGPAANLVMALFWGVMGVLSWSVPEFFSLPLSGMAKIGIRVNCILMILNLLPLPPLDGGRILESLLPSRWAWKFARIEPWGFPILLVLLATGVLGSIMYPLADVMMSLVARIFGL